MATIVLARRHILRSAAQGFATALIASAALVGVATSSANGPSHQIPTTIAADCSVDVTQAIQNWIGSVPNNSTLVFSSGGCYRIDGTVLVRNRSGLTFEGNSATFRAMTVGGSHRAHWQVVDGSSVAFRNMTIRGPRTDTGFVSELQWQHAVDFRGTAGITIEHVTVSDVYGDCFYLGQGWDSRKAWATAARLSENTCLRNGRMGVAVTAARQVLVETSRFEQIGLSVFDVEPNGTGFGASDVTFDRNRVGVARDYVFVVTGTGPVDNVRFSNTTIVGNRMRVGAFAFNGDRRSNISVVGNTSDSGYFEKNGAVMRFQAIDGVIVRGNHAPIASSNTALVETTDACSVDVGGNTFPGGSAELRVATACSISTTPAPASPADTTAPTAPGNLTASATSSTAVSLAWTASTDDVGVAGYRVFRDGALVETTASTAYSDSGLTAGTTYHYSVVAFDAAGNTSTAATASVTTPAITPTTVIVSSPADTTAPTAPGNLTASATSSTAVSLAWTASTDDVGVAGYRVFRDGSLVETTASTAYSDSGLTAGTTYHYSVVAFDAAGNTSTAATASVTTPAITPTTVIVSTDVLAAPEELTAIRGKGRHVGLSWRDGGGSSAVAAYRLYRNGARIATVTSMSHSDSVPGNISTATYVVTAVDAAGVESAASGEVSIKMR